LIVLQPPVLVLEQTICSLQLADSLALTLLFDL